MTRASAEHLENGVTNIFNFALTVLFVCAPFHHVALVAEVTPLLSVGPCTLDCSGTSDCNGLNITFDLYTDPVTGQNSVTVCYQHGLFIDCNSSLRSYLSSRPFDSSHGFCETTVFPCDDMTWNDVDSCEDVCVECS